MKHCLTFGQLCAVIAFVTSIFNTARSIYTALATDKAAEVQIRTEQKALALSIAIDPSKSFELTSSTVNGQSMSGNRTISNHDRLEILSLVVKMYDNNAVATTRTRPIF
jgi:hypothetical protein